MVPSSNSFDSKFNQCKRPRVHQSATATLKVHILPGLSLASHPDAWLRDCVNTFYFQSSSFAKYNVLDCLISSTYALQVHYFIYCPFLLSVCSSLNELYLRRLWSQIIPALSNFLVFLTPGNLQLILTPCFIAAHSPSDKALKS